MKTPRKATLFRKLLSFQFVHDTRMDGRLDSLLLTIVVNDRAVMHVLLNLGIEYLPERAA